MRPERWFYTVPLRLRSLFRRRQVEKELDEELQYHLERKTEEFLARGMMPEKAHFAALGAMEGLDQQKERCRDTRRVNPIEHFIQDFHCGLRMLAKSPGFTAVAVLTLALGIGANTAVFSIVNAVLLRPLPLPHGERVVSIQVTPMLADETTGPASPLQFCAWRAHNREFALLAAVRSLRGQVSGKECPEEILVLEDDYRTGAPRVCLISHRLWQRRYSEDRNIIGRVLNLDSKSTLIIGVLPPDFAFPDAEHDLWTVLHLNPEHQTERTLDVYGLLNSVFQLRMPRHGLLQSL